jgi:formylglycine-generating enzyme required for sulfatase activity
MGLLAKIGDFCSDLFTGFTAMYTPNGGAIITAQTQRENAIITAQTQRENAIINATVQRQNTIDKINADWNLQQDRQEFQAEIENRRQNFEVKKLEAQWLHQYNLQKDSQQFNYEEGRRKHQESVALANLNHENQQKIERFRQEWENIRLQKRQDFELLIFEERKKHEWEIKEYDRQTSMMISNINLKNTLVSAEYSRILDKHPLVTLCAPTLDFYKNLNLQNSTPLLIIISPPAVEFEQYPHAAQGFAKIETKLTDNLHEFLDQNYNLSQSIRPTKFLGSSWETKSIHGHGAMSILHYTHKSVPTVVIESKVDGDTINIYLGFWDSMDSDFKYKKVMSIPWQEFLYPLARENAKKWREAKNKLFELGRTPAEIDARGGDNQKNLLLLEEEEINQQYDINTKINYHINGDEYTKELAEFLSVIHCLFAGLAADQYHLAHSNVMPILPQKLPELLQNVPDGDAKQSLIQRIIKIYEENYQGIELLNPSLLPDLVLDFAASLFTLNESVFAREQLNLALNCWLKLRGVILTPQSDSVIFTGHLLKAIATVVTPLDQEYITKVNPLLSKLNETPISIIDLCYNRGAKRLETGQVSLAITDFTQVIDLANSGQKSTKYASVLEYAYYCRGQCFAPLKNYQNAIADFTQAIAIKSDYLDCYYQRGNAYYHQGSHQKAIADYERALYLQPDWPEVAKQKAIVQGVLDEIIRKKDSDEAEKIRLQNEKGELFTFDVVKVNSQGTIISTVSTTGYQKKYDIGNGVILEMVYIPPGSFKRSDGKTVTIKEPFYMGKYPVTNEQYQQIIGSSSSGSGFDGKKQPVVNVSWDQAQDFCDRLSQKITLKCLLTTESQWEYACRAGTDSEFYFGETITTDLANYDGNYTYGNGPKGEYRQKTTEVGSFPPNAFGLYDLHGNVWEWCLDDWHDDYSRTPIDGSANITTNINNYKVMCGGSWSYDPQYCRGAVRDWVTRDSRFRDGGFRLVFSPFRT